MAELYSCPFCRELFSEEEGPACPECDLPLVPLKNLPLSLDGRAEMLIDAAVDPPEDVKLPVWYWGRSRGALTLLSGLGIGLFFSPWVSIERPDPVELSGYDLAVSTAPFLWGGAVGWFILAALVLSRRSVHEMRGVRAIATLFCALTAGEVGLFLLRPPTGHAYFSSGLSYEWGFFLSGVVAVLGMFFAVRFGGSLQDLRDLPIDAPPQGPVVGENVH